MKCLSRDDGKLSCAVLRGLGTGNSPLRNGVTSSFGREEINKDDLFDKMTSWYSLHKESSPDQLAKMYFEKGSQKQKGDALNYLLKSDLTLHRPFIEAQLLKSPSDSCVSEMVMKYAKATGTFCCYICP